MHCILTLIKVCSPWRSTILKHKVSWARAAICLPHPELVRKFLDLAGDVPMFLDFEHFLQMKSPSSTFTPSKRFPLPALKSLIKSLADEQRLRNAKRITGFTYTHDLNWAFILHNSFANLQRFEGCLDMPSGRDLPVLSAPKLEHLHLTSARPEPIETTADKLVNFLTHLPGLRYVHLVRFYVVNKRASSQQAVLHYLETLLLEDTTPLTFHVLKPLAPKARISMDTRYDMQLAAFWEHAALDGISNVELMITPVLDDGVISTVYDPSETLRAEIRLEDGFVGRKGYVSKGYYLNEDEDADIGGNQDVESEEMQIAINDMVASFLADLQLYQHAVKSVALTAFRTLSINGQADLMTAREPRVVQATMHALGDQIQFKDVVFDPLKHTACNSAAELISSNLRDPEPTLTIITRAHGNSRKDLDQAAVDAVCSWLEQPELLKRVQVQLVGRN